MARRPGWYPDHLYFARSLRDGSIKIGASSDIAKRLARLEKDHGDKLELLATAAGYGRHEFAVHRAFARLRIDKPHSGLAESLKPTGPGQSGAAEWYAPRRALLDFIAAVDREPMHVLSVLAPNGPASELDLYLAVGAP